MVSNWPCHVQDILMVISSLLNPSVRILLKKENSEEGRYSYNEIIVVITAASPHIVHQLTKYVLLLSHTYLRIPSTVNVSYLAPKTVLHLFRLHCLLHYCSNFLGISGNEHQNIVWLLIFCANIFMHKGKYLKTNLTYRRWVLVVYREQLKVRYL